MMLHAVSSANTSAMVREKMKGSGRIHSFGFVFCCLLFSFLDFTFRTLKEVSAELKWDEEMLSMAFCYNVNNEARRMDDLHISAGPFSDILRPARSKSFTF